MFSATIRKCTGIKYKLNNWNPGHTVQLACNTVHQLLCSLLKSHRTGFHVVPIIPSRYYRVGSILTQGKSTDQLLIGKHYHKNVIFLFMRDLFHFLTFENVNQWVLILGNVLPCQRTLIGAKRKFHKSML